MLAALLPGCGKSECKKYTEHFCKDAASPQCASAIEKVKDLSSNQCRIELNQLQIDEQSKRLEDELK
ncbi:hypothetical protein Turpa_4116 [Turneriella parva DSM 21527]|uniref:Uncharacterized protein n=2 Tax=Turneriella TaxID=338321 RepID=I4BBU2_TURPD|nr:hypothetical protein Turpa_4116 [Turneriella parva DSM 21527]